MKQILKQLYSHCYNQWVRWIMDYGFYGFKIHKIHNPWILKWIWNGLPKSIIHMDLKTFSAAGLFVSKLRARLGQKSIDSLVVLN